MKEAIKYGVKDWISKFTERAVFGILTAIALRIVRKLGIKKLLK